MSSELNHIQLSSLVIGEWYKDALLASPEASPDAPAAPQRPAPPPVSAATPPAVAPRPPAPTAAEPKPAPQAPAAPKQTPPAEPGAYKFLGNNRKKITILVQSPGIPFLPDNQLTFLTRMLEACRMNIGDVAIVNTATTPVTITALKQQLQPASILLFGLEPTAIKLPINFPVFKVQPYDDCSYLSAPALNLLVQPSEESKLLKSKLWVCLKTLFNV